MQETFPLLFSKRYKAAPIHPAFPLPGTLTSPVPGRTHIDHTSFGTWDSTPALWRSSWTRLREGQGTGVLSLLRWLSLRSMSTCRDSCCLQHQESHSRRQRLGKTSVSQETQQNKRMQKDCQDSSKPGRQRSATPSGAGPFFSLSPLEKLQK